MSFKLARKNLLRETLFLKKLPKRQRRKVRLTKSSDEK